MASTNVEPLPGKVGVGRRKRVEARKNIGEGKRGFEIGKKIKDWDGLWGKGWGKWLRGRGLRWVNGLGNHNQILYNFHINHKNATQTWLFI